MRSGYSKQSAGTRLLDFQFCWKIDVIVNSGVSQSSDISVEVCSVAGQYDAGCLSGCTSVTSQHVAAEQLSNSTVTDRVLLHSTSVFQ